MNTISVEYSTCWIISSTTIVISSVRKTEGQLQSRFILTNSSNLHQPEVNRFRIACVQNTPLPNSWVCLNVPLLDVKVRRGCQGHILGLGSITQLALGEVLGHNLKSGSREPLVLCFQLPRGTNIWRSSSRRNCGFQLHCLRQEDQYKANVPITPNWKEEGIGLSFSEIPCFCT